MVLLAGAAFGQAKRMLTAAPSSANPVVRAAIDELVLASRILAHNGVLDAYGHVSVRSPVDPNRFFLARSGPAGIVRAEDIIEYDLDAKPVAKTDFAQFSEKFIHSQMYRARADVKAVVHGHAPELVTFSVTAVPLKPIAHMAAFLGDGAPVFEIRDATKSGDMLIGNDALGAALAKSLGDRPAALMRGHGAIVVAESLHIVTGRAFYMTANARELAQALLIGGGKVTYLNADEARQMAAQDGFERAWKLWAAEEAARK